MFVPSKNKKNEIYNVPYVLQNAGNIRREHYCIILSFKIYTIEPLQTAEVFLFKINLKKVIKK